MYQLGVGKPHDNAQAARLFKRACDWGYALGCNDLAGLYRVSGGADFTQIFSLFKKACDTGNALGCNNLGRMYKRGESVTMDMEKAAELFAALAMKGPARHV